MKYLKWEPTKAIFRQEKIYTNKETIDRLDAIVAEMLTGTAARTFQSIAELKHSTKDSVHRIADAKALDLGFEKYLVSKIVGDVVRKVEIALNKMRNEI